ncbi:4-hydroxybenzoate octaprenyltransferase [Thiopseudomonas alkaliphila]|uniref:4-hydroxybenzoate octaprenyltransferase n=1 Tax=Thiopseudomonas alkaliphila TaxID=1697053 RepID=UPI00069E195A|nr:4-hydroxybenzoate octaprenyltransferase [Thiopseudomonas alkaliphila]AKX50989.1 4-hydroxybenzoate polyprenyltransferase [Thiopseudomonas alkaliphila]AKX57346.1 4-hydroxybenzoate polyprenyltransferase [Thiopseudomonas alkaliphila]
MYQHLLQSLSRLHPRAWDFIRLTRFERPIGIYLLLWPTLTALWIAGDGSPSLKNVLIFTLGVAFMRAAGCAINDYADREFDGHVARTQDRPLATGRISPKEALLTAAVLTGISFILVLMTNGTTVFWAFGAVLLAACYPFMKRYTFYPQVFLGAAYSWGIFMAFTAEQGSVPAAAMILYLANLLWTIAYDTYYAIADLEDDLKIGVKSTAVAFGKSVRSIIFTLQILMLLLLSWAGQLFELSDAFYWGLFAALICYLWELWHTRGNHPQRCFEAFLHNHWAGLCIFLGSVVATL